MKNNKLYLPLFLSIAVAIGIIIGSLLDYPKNNSILLFNRNNQELKIKRLIDYIEYDYVDKVDTDSLLDGTIQQLLGKLDPHSVYIPASERNSIAESMNGEFVGIGIQFRFYKDSLYVIKVLDGGPSSKVGIQSGDRILIANNDTLYNKNINNTFIQEKLKGEPNTKVNLVVYRKSKDTILNFSLKRGNVPIKSVDAFYKINDSLGYIKINKFASTTFDEFKTAMSMLLNQNMKHLVLDLRGNPGGYLGIATQIADEFLANKKLIVFTKNKGGKIDKTYATSKGSFENGKIYVLIDENSASASEIVAGALQDNDQGTIVGRRSFGKGLVQQEMDLGDGSAVRLTVSRYYTPTGRSIQKPYDDKNNYYNDHFIRLEHGELTNGDSIRVNDSLRFITPKGKIVYGGGGIVPDVFVSIDTTAFFGRFHFDAMRNFVLEYVDNHRAQFDDMSFNDFMSTFDKENDITGAYIDLIHKNYKVNNLNIPYIKQYLKSLFAQMIFDDNHFYEVLNKDDKVLEKVLQIENESRIKNKKD
jgi:carboxyl-terminal processing protease